MRPRMMLAALGAAAAAAALAPAGALAARPSAAGGCAISIQVAPRVITTGDPVVIFGRLRCPARVGRPVQLFHHLPGQRRFTLVGAVRTDASGFYEFSRADGVVDTNRSWYVRSRGVRSSTRTIRVAAEITLAGPPDGSNLLTGPKDAVTFTGSVDPSDAGARVILQRQNAATGGDWRRIDASTVGANGSFTIMHTFKVPGDANVRVLVRSQGRNIPSPSQVLTYEISQAQNPNLTIAASQDPIPFGQSLTISGTVANGALAPLTLYARTARGGRTAVATTVADAAGNYTFPAQSPTYNTAYQVTRTTGAASAVLYEGVRDGLTAQVSTSSVPAGQPVTFSGTVSPDHSGHVIYLERQNASGNGFHVVQVALVGSGSGYSITHRFYDTGTKVVRVFIPGGPENQGAASQPFTITVAPAPAATLTPDSGANSSQPPAGQQ